jgi:hypothetical protein
LADKKISNLVAIAAVDVAADDSFVVVDKSANTTNKINANETSKLMMLQRQQAHIAGITTSASAGSLPTPDGTVTIADAATPTVTELLEYCVELEAKVEALLTALIATQLIAAS